MKWKIDYVWTKIESVIPDARSFGYAIPEALKAAAIELFILDEGHHNGSFRAYVISTCLLELKAVGYLTEGTISEDWI
jgi:hypothetical protein